MDKLIAKVIKKNADVVDFIRDMLAEEPDLSTQEIKDRVYKEFTFQRFARNTIVMQMLICAGRQELGDE